MNQYYGKCLSTEETAKLLKVTIYTVYNYILTKLSQTLSCWN